MESAAQRPALKRMPDAHRFTVGHVRHVGTAPTNLERNQETLSRTACVISARRVQFAAVAFAYSSACVRFSRVR